MKHIYAYSQLGLALLLYLIVIVTIVNLVLISMRPETISVVNVFIGQGVISICLVALGRILWRKGRASLQAANSAAESGQQDA